ncbi:DUF1616 domain-containing protein [Halostella litorea]|uniref:DUF1616 domain-containing protein n=1 Tax=Halostella litorea TaxID=2528831 RepID=UPI00109280B4|nr:DUF1616 domain-containing protein [Halostella litorea]
MKYRRTNDSPRSRLGRLPLDLVVAVGFALVAGVVVFAGVGPALLRAAVGVPLLLFLPGYVVVAAAFPGRPDAATPDRFLAGRADDAPAGVDGVERAALAFGMSVAVLPLLTLAIAASPLALAAPAVVAVFVGAVCLGAAVAAVRRMRIPADARFRVPAARWAAELRGAVLGTDRRSVGVVNAVLVLSVLLAAGTMGYALAAPQDGESYSSIALLTENESGGLEADGYDTNLTRGETTDLVVSVENSEGSETNYTVVAVVERVEPTAEGVRVLERQELDRFGATVGPGEMWRQRHAAAPELVGDDLRLTYYLYRGDAPGTVSNGTAYESVYLSIDVAWGE